MDLKSLFEPRSVAVVGASRQKGKVGYEILTGLIKGGFEGEIYPVNQACEELMGLRCYPTLAAIGKTPGMAVIVVPVKAVAGVMQECASLGIKAVIVITSGFKEVGEEGRKLEEQIVKIARSGGITMLGPNCLGILSPDHKLNASFAGLLPRLGKIAYLSQSGSLLAAIIDMASAIDLGFSKLASIGNKAAIDELDLLRFYGQDEQTEVIAGYLETIADGDAFVREAERISHDKPILLMKAGETGAGAEAASSHTGRLPGIERAREVVFERAGVIRCWSIKQQFDYASAFANQPLPNGPSVAIIANTGGLGIMAADAIEREGLRLARLQEATTSGLGRSLPAAANINNPIDVLGDALADRYEYALGHVLEDPNVDSALVLLTPHAMTECERTAQAIVRASRQDKPILACFLGSSRVQESIHILRKGRIPCYDSPEAAVRVLRVMSEYARWRSRPKRVIRLFPVNRRKVEKIVERRLRTGGRELGELEAKETLEAYGFVTPQSLLATSPEQAVSFADQIGYPVVLKIWSPDIIHKSEVGGVRLGLMTPQEVMDGFDLMMYRIPKKRPDAEILGVLVQEMCKRGREVVLGMHRDPHYGPLMMFGAGGSMVEVLEDAAFYLAPLTADEAREMLKSSRTYRALLGDQAREGVDVDAIGEGLQRLSQLATEFPQIQKIDINPYMVGRQGTVPIAVDARIIVDQPT